MSAILRLSKPIVMVGMMGSGKSHVGRLLAQDLSLDFYDTDAIIEERQGVKIAEMFVKQGEAFFRALERDVISELLSAGSCVISIGGGAVTTPEVLEDIKSRGVSVWMPVDLDVIYHRVRGDKSRPLLQGVDLKEKIVSLLKVRQSLYAQADIEVDNSGDDPQKTVEKIVKELENFCGIEGA